MSPIEIITNVAAVMTFCSTIVLVARWYYFRYIDQRVTWKKAEKYAAKIANQISISKFKPTLIFGIGRGGAVFGSMISGCLGNVPILVIDRQYLFDEKGRIDSMLFKARIPSNILKDVLLVAGNAVSGNTMRVYNDFLTKCGAKHIRTAALYQVKTCTASIHYHGLITDKNEIKLPWMFSNNYRIERKKPEIDIIADNTIPSGITLYLVRHMETEANHENKIIGRSDSDLTLEGISKAVEIAGYFNGKRVTAVYTSPTGRANKTATILNSTIMSNIIEDPDLLELDFGVWENKLKSEVVGTPEYALWNQNPALNPPKNGESPFDALHRIQNFLGKMKSAYKSGDEILAVTHRSLMRILIAHILLGGIEEYRSIDIKNGGIVKLFYDGTTWKVDEDEFQIDRVMPGSEL